jgi:hypothetical protein
MISPRSPTLMSGSQCFALSVLVLATAAPARSLSLGTGPRMSVTAPPLAPEQRAGLVLWPDADSVRRSLPGAGAPIPTGAREAPEGGWWDGATLGGCVVRRFTDEMQGDRWMLWYSARSASFNAGVVPLATGAVGLAQSADGVNWERLAGDEAGGACLTPNAEEWWGFDTTHVGVGEMASLTPSVASAPLFIIGAPFSAVICPPRCHRLHLPRPS